MKPRDAQNVSKLHGRTYKNGKYENTDAPTVTEIVELPSKTTAGAVKPTAKTPPKPVARNTDPGTESNRLLTLAVLNLSGKGMLRK